MGIGLQGAPGERGEQGPQGPQGPAGFNGVDRVQQPVSVPAGSTGKVGTAACGFGQRVVGGGASVTDPLFASYMTTYQSYPDSNSSWTVRLGNLGSAHALTVTVYALCVAG
jgi:hypothetical protein